jgi:hypothetical protein
LTEKDWNVLPQITTHDPAALLNLQNAYLRVRLAFISPSTIAIYWVRGPEGDFRIEEPLLMEAIFLDARTGALKHREKWPVGKRHQSSDRGDTEGRILPVDGGRFVVQAHGELFLYSSDFKLLKQHELDPDLHDTWSIRIPMGGRRLFVRHEYSSGAQHREYWWFDVDTLSQIHPDPAPPTGELIVRGDVLPTDFGYYIAKEKKLSPYPAQGIATIPCDPLHCSYVVQAVPLAGGYVILQSEKSAILYTREGHEAWSRRTSAETVSYGMVASLDGSSFSLQWSGRQGQFDGVPLSDKRWTVFVYDLKDMKRTLAVPIPFGLEITYALAPDGSALATLHGTTLEVFACDRQ